MTTDLHHPPAASHTLEPLRKRLLEHELYQRIETLEALQTFMQDHAFAVWDFMSLLKALQRELTCIDVPWMPVQHPRLSRLINEIVLGEESDITPDGEAISHFGLYLRAMQDSGANTTPIETFITHLRATSDVEAALTAAAAPDHVRAFVRQTFAVIADGKLHEIAAAFTFGREDLIPSLFGGIVAQVDEVSGGKLHLFRYYLQRHIELDGDEHGALGREMVEHLCDGCPEREQQALTSAAAALRARTALWDGINEAVKKSPTAPGPPATCH